jgi:prepilin-type processing-associated H-X9-DG protein
LTVLALLAFLLGLLLPAIQRIRQAAARAQSQNNLKQLALACHSYHDVYKHLPSGNDGINFSTAVYLLPFIEQQNLYNQIDFNKSLTDEANAAVRRTVVPTFLSPLDPESKLPNQYGPTSYLFSAGSKYALADNNGVFYQDSKIKLTQIPDGTSNTLLIGETLKGNGGTKAVTVQRQHVLLTKEALKDLKETSGIEEFKQNQHIVGDRCASWMDGRFLQGTFTATRLFNDERPDVNCAGTGGLSGLRSLMNGTNVAMCDGSVRFVRSNLSQQVWNWLADRSDGNVIPDF